MSHHPPNVAYGHVNPTDELAHLRSQNEQLWKIVEKQRVMIQNLQKDSSRLAAERDGILDKYRHLEREMGRTQRQRAASILISPEMLREIAEADDLAATPSETSPAMELPLPGIVTSNLGVSGSSSPVPPPRSPFRSVKDNNLKQQQQPSQLDEVAQTAHKEQLQHQRAKQFNFSLEQSPPSSPADPTSPTSAAIMEKDAQISRKPPLPSGPPPTPTPSKSASTTLDVRKARARESMMPPPRSQLLEHDPTMRAASPPLPRAAMRHSLYVPSSRANTGKRESTIFLPPLPPRTNSSDDDEAHSIAVPVIQEPGAMERPESPMSDTGALGNIANVAVKVIGSNIKVNERGKEVISFVISVGKKRVEGDDETEISEYGFHELWRVEKLYSDFLDLDAKLKAQNNHSVTSKISKLPDKAMFTTHAPNKVDQRKIALEQYLQHTVTLPWDDMSDLCEFLSTNVIEHDVRVATGKEGYLTKRGKNFGGWKTRYFVLNDSIIDYYETKGGQHLGTIRLTNAQIGRQTPGVTPVADDSNSIYRHAFLIIEQKRAGSSHVVRHILCANSDLDRDEWVEAIYQNIRFDEDPSLEFTTPKDKKKSKNKTEKGRKLSKGEIRTVAASPISQLKGGEEIEKFNNVPSVMEPEPPVVGMAVSSGPTPSVSSESTDSSLLSTSLPSANAGGMWPNNAAEIGRASLDQHSRSLHTPPPILVRRSSTTNLHDDDHAPPPPPPRSLSPTMMGRSSEDLNEDGSAEKKAKNKANRMTFWGKKMFSSSSSSENSSSNMLSSDSPPAPRASMAPAGFRNFLSRTSNESAERQTSSSQQRAKSPGGGPGGQGADAPGPKQVFGVGLEDAVRVSRVVEGYELPAIVYRCIEYLDAKNAVMEEGLYRLSGSTTVMKNLKAKFNKEGDVNLLQSKQEYDVHAIAGLLKMWLRELPTSVLTRERRMDFLHVIDLLDRKDRVNELGRLVSQLPLANYTLLRALTAHLIRVVQHSDINKMTVRNVSIVFSPTLGIPAMIFNLFMSEFEYIFWTTEEGDAAPRMLEDDNTEEQPSQEQQQSPMASQAAAGPSDTASHPHEQLVDRHPEGKQRAEENTRPSPPPGAPLGRKPTLKLREEFGRSNRNSVNYIDGAPNAIVELERNMDGPPVLDEDDEEVDELNLSAEPSDESDKPSASATTSPTSHTTPPPSSSSISPATTMTIPPSQP
ncbi:hypothetical protein BCR43DRAFT_499172 [Syncephalastrum racemosum]|uniref:RhoGAP-domain-containing protein n=1 Tax=Syncephalastrum racemosum TaxID=13706 RepID=A0A1X2GZV9_SYNRA|nr:hypothetical protein BCR43DRAFT_499172 [Syncephalastrum racemosum]